MVLSQVHSRGCLKNPIMNFASVSVAATGKALLSLSHCLHEKSIPKTVCSSPFCFAVLQLPLPMSTLGTSW
jgi:hypothetical protein